jgi:hypothetical protein
MDRAVLAALLTALLVLSAGPVAGHGNHIEADAQRSADGTVVVETVLPLVDGFVVLHQTDEDGNLGDPIGHERMDAADGFQQGVRVQMDADAWANWSGSDTLWIAYHEDNGAETFDPEEDPVLSVFGSLNGASIQLERADHPAYVLAERSQPQQTTNATATLGQVALGTDGYAVLRTESGTDGRVVGVTPLDAGVYENVTVALDDSVFSGNESRAGLYAQLYTEAGDGSGTTAADGTANEEFSESDELVRAGGKPVSTYFLVRQVNASADSSPVVQTPTGNSGDVVTPTATDSATTSEQPTTETRSDPAADGTPSGVAGFGLAHAIVAALAAAVLLVRR